MTGTVDLRTLLFDDPAGAADALAATVLGQPGGDMDGAVRAMPEAARKAALTRLTEAATGLLEQTSPRSSSTAGASTRGSARRLGPAWPSRTPGGPSAWPRTPSRSTTNPRWSCT
ncbi:hypothetical protein JIG36_05020 [Actinoplanes sp. LDG1-06]|uniref:Uncharacterized protein n=1 Tax=Paractinoplanes ovalisporus TaxID=2810368 RepID=A0ABS2A519_9ACTN|nr:hypothetical protein [Actinoplanes ovalisporus]MBM2614919.1 hypothetical protein [Actinoplanes ovalisporus]